MYTIFQGKMKELLIKISLTYVLLYTGIPFMVNIIKGLNLNSFYQLIVQYIPPDTGKPPEGDGSGSRT